MQNSLGKVKDTQIKVNTEVLLIIVWKIYCFIFGLKNVWIRKVFVEGTANKLIS